MNDPFEEVNRQQQEKSKVKRQPGQVRQAASTTLKLDPKNFDWFLAGIDQSRVAAIMNRNTKSKQEIVLSDF